MTGRGGGGIVDSREERMLMKAWMCVIGLWGGLAAAGPDGAMKEEPKAMTAERVVRRTWGDGRWFDGDARALRAEVEGYLADAKVPSPPAPFIAGVSPHAGFVYSGKVAGYTFRALQEAAKAGHGPDTVVVLGFCHRGGTDAVALMDGDAIRTPLGEIPLDGEARQYLADTCKGAEVNYAPHRGEHSAENQLPFVQVAVPKAKLVVALIGSHDMAVVEDLVQALRGLAKQKRIAVIASTDLLHDPDYERVKQMDGLTVERLKQMDAPAIVDTWSFREQTMCGVCPVLTAVLFAREQGCKEGAVLHYRNSGDDHPESRGQWVVGYAAVVYYTDAAQH